MTDPGAPDDEGRGIEWGGLPSPQLVRATLGLVAGIVVAAVGALLLGEYQFEGALPYAAGALFGFVIGEVVVEVGRRRTVPVALVAGLASAAGLLGAGWISSGEGLEPIASGAWIAAGIGAVCAAVRVAGLRRRQGTSATTVHEPGS